jgi:hypothetical protein
MLSAPPHNFRQIRAGDRAKRLLGWLDDGSPILEHPTDDLETFHVIPAQTGWFTLHWFDDGADDEDCLCRVAIIAWRVSMTSGLTHDGKILQTSWSTPIVADNCDVDALDILGPDGLVYRFDYSPQPFGQWLEGKKQERAARREKPELKAVA